MCTNAFLNILDKIWRSLHYDKQLALKNSQLLKMCTKWTKLQRARKELWGEYDDYYIIQKEPFASFSYQQLHFY